MSKPLTIEELKALSVGDWVWIDYILGGSKFYTRKYAKSDAVFDITEIPCELPYFDYNKTWLAYKNKEQAEAKGEIVELPCIRKSKSTTLPQYEVVYIGEYDKIIVERFTFEPAAKRRLAELKGEKV